MGNICRSPLAEGVFRHLLRQANLEQVIHLDSAGTHFYHVGNPPDPRSIAVAHKAGYDISAQCCRQVQPEDYHQFDWMIAMDQRNLRDLAGLAPSVALKAKPRLLLDFSRDALQETEVPDPYHEGPEGFEYVLKLVESGCSGLLQTILEDLQLPMQKV